MIARRTILQALAASAAAASLPAVLREALAAPDHQPPQPLPAIPCDGRALLRVEYPELFAVIGTTYGSTSSANFLVPDMRTKNDISRECDVAAIEHDGRLPGEMRLRIQLMGYGVMRYDIQR